MLKFFILLSLLAAAQCCTVDVRNDGTSTARNAHPSHVMIENFLSFKSKRMCSGVLLNPNYVITTGTCVEGFMFVNVHIYPHMLRELYEPYREIYRATLVTFKPGYNNETHSNDVAVVKLPMTLLASPSTYGYATLPDPIEQLLPGVTGITVGWGLLNYNDENAVNFKQSTDMVVTTNPECRAAYTGKWTDDSDYNGRMCIRKLTAGTSICETDVGSPFYLNNVIIGLQSFGQREACEIGIPTGIQEVRYHVIWVEDAIRV